MHSVHVVKDFYVKMLGIRNNKLMNRAHALGKNKMNGLVIVYISDDSDINFLLKNGNKLKEMEYDIHCDSYKEIRMYWQNYLFYKKEKLK